MDQTRPAVRQQFMAPSKKGSEARVVGIDFVATLSSSTTQNLLALYILNPKDSTSFPRLSAIAGVWCRYFFRKLRFHIFGISAATQKGYTVMASFVNDDLAQDPAITNEAQLLNLENVAVGRPWSYSIHEVNLGAQGLEWYTCDGSASTPAGEYVGKALAGAATTAVAGDIQYQVYVEYDVEFAVRSAVGTLTEPNGFSVVRVQESRLKR